MFASFGVLELHGMGCSVCGGVWASKHARVAAYGSHGIREGGRDANFDALSDRAPETETAQFQSLEFEKTTNF